MINKITYLLDKTIHIIKMHLYRGILDKELEKPYITY